VLVDLEERILKNFTKREERERRRNSPQYTKAR
jgi:hypothetical protein